MNLQEQRYTFVHPDAKPSDIPTEKDLKIIVGNRIRYRIDELGLTNKVVAKDAEISQSGLGKIIRGEASPSNLTVGRLSVVLDQPPSWFAPRPDSISPAVLELHRKAYEKFQQAHDTVKEDRRIALTQGLQVLENLPTPSEQPIQKAPMIPIVGYVAAGDQVFPFDEYPHGDGIDQIEGDVGMSPQTVAAKLKGDSYSDVFGGETIIFWSTRRFDVENFVGRLVVCHLANGMKTMKKLMRGSEPGLYNLHSTNFDTMIDQLVESVSPIDSIRPR